MSVGLTLFDKVKKISNQKGFSLAELARRARIGEKSIYTWKPSKTYPDGVTPSRDILERVAKELNVSVEYLLGTDDTLSSSESDEYYRMNTDGLSKEEIDDIKEQLKFAEEIARRRLGKK